MKHLSAADVEDALERRRIYLSDPAAFPVIAELLNKRIDKDEPVPGRRGSSVDDCIVTWAPGWAERICS
jgi:hypothetical protein